MKAIRVQQFGGPEVLKLETVDDPQPQRGEVVIRVRAAGVNPYDTLMRSGSYGANNPALPYTPGSDAAGVVESIGPEVQGWKRGDRVFTAGTRGGAYAERALCTSEQLHRLPERVSFAQGAGVYVPYATAYRSLFQLAHARPGEVVLVHGASGGVGLAAVQFAHATGMTIIGTAGTDEGLELVRAAGAQITINHRSPDYQRQIMEATKGHGADVILEMLANVNLGRDLQMLARRGRVVVIGSRGDVQITPREIMMREAAVIGMYLWGVPPADAIEIHAAVEAGLSNGTLQPSIGLELPLASASEAHRRIVEPGALGKTVLVPQQ
jgi:NADPH:quinone reductase